MERNSKVRFGYQVEEPGRSSVRSGAHVLISSLQLGLEV